MRASISIGPVRQLPEVFAVLGRQLLVRPRGGEPGHLVEVGAVVEPARRLVVIAANHRLGLERADAVDDGVRRGAVADQVAEHEDAIPRRGGGEDGLERIDVGVDVRQDQVAHIAHIFSRRSTICSAISSAGAAPASTRTCACAYAAWRTANSRSSWLRSAASGRRPSAGSGDQQIERHVEPDRHAVHVHRRAILGVHERPAAGRDDDVAERQQQLEDLALDGAEVRLALPGEDVGDGPALARFDQLVDVLGPPAQTCGECPRDGALAGRHEPDQIDLVDCHLGVVSRSSSWKKPGYDTSTAPAPVIVVGVAAPVAATANAMASRWSPAASTTAPSSGPRFDAEAVGILANLGAHRPEARRPGPRCGRFP